MRVIAFYSPKGGVGKTAAAVNIAYLASRDQLPTLLWDLDPQGAAGFYLAGAQPLQGRKLSRLLEGRTPVARFVRENVYPGLDLIPSHPSFRNFDARLEGRKTDFSLKKLLASLSEETSLVVLDCPPTMSRLTEQVLAVADQVYVPLVPTWLSLNSWQQLHAFVRRQKLPVRKLRPFFSMVDRRRKLHRELTESGAAGIERLLDVAIPYASVVERMGEQGQPLEVLAPATAAAAAYRQLWHHIRKDLGLL